MPFSSVIVPERRLLSDSARIETAANSTGCLTVFPAPSPQLMLVILLRKEVAGLKTETEDAKGQQT